MHFHATDCKLQSLTGQPNDDKQTLFGSPIKNVRKNTAKVDPPCPLLSALGHTYLTLRADVIYAVMLIRTGHARTRTRTKPTRTRTRTRTRLARTRTRTRTRTKPTRTRTMTRTSLTVTYCKLQLNLQSLSSNNNEHKVKIHNI